MLTHIARNADSVVWRLEGAARGELRDQYPGGLEQRADDIEAGAGRPAAELVRDVRRTSAAVERAMAELPVAAWDAPSRTSRGVVESSRDAVLVALARGGGPPRRPGPRPGAVPADAGRRLAAAGAAAAGGADGPGAGSWPGSSAGVSRRSWRPGSRARPPPAATRRRTRCRSGPPPRSTWSSGTRCSVRAWPSSMSVPALHVVPFQPNTRPMESTARQNVGVGQETAVSPEASVPVEGRLGGDGGRRREGEAVPGQARRRCCPPARRRTPTRRRRS